MIHFIKIVLPIKVNQEFTYSIDYEGDISKIIACRVLVKLGEKVTTGLIVNTDSETHSFDIKPIIKLVDFEPILTKKQLELAYWISKYYVSEIGIVVFSMLPSNFNKLSNLIIKKLDYDIAKIDVKLTPNNKKILDFLEKHKKNLSFDYIKKNLKISNLKQSLEQLESLAFVSLEDKFQEAQFVFEDYIQFNFKLFDKDIETEYYFKQFKIKSKIDKEIIEYFLNNRNLFDTPVSKENLTERVNCNSVALKRLKDKGIIEVIKVKRDRSLSTLSDDDFSVNELLLEPNKEQSEAIQKINLLVEEKKTIFLNAVTGAGKTLIYMHQIQQALDEGCSCLLLVPEIALTNNLFERFEKAFPNQVHTYHSRMSSGAKFDLWHKIKKGNGNFVIGTRSAVFLPFSDLKLIIVDEEHDSSYKQSDKNPRYNARDIAVYRAYLESFSVILASATASLETYYNAKIGKYSSVEIKHRADNAALPKISVVDFLDAKIKASVKSNFTNVFLEKMFEKIANNEQIIIFLNRRGYSAFLLCRDCGDIKKCKNCDVAMTYHQKNNLLKCHYCGYQTAAEMNCYNCGSHKISNIGLGTERIEAEIRELLTEIGIDIGIKRLDSDTAKTEKQINRIIKDFQENKFQILIGTQILAKGFNFKNLTLVGVINADLELYRADFRANERTFQLLEQVSGRTGRTKEKPGEVVIQTYHPDNYAIKYVKSHSYNDFAEEELIYRENSEYPPFWRMSKLIISGKSESEVSKTAKQVYNLIKINTNDIKVYEPISPVISLINKNYRQYIYVKIRRTKSGFLLAKFKEIIDGASFKLNKNIKIDFDVDTYSEN